MTGLIACSGARAAAQAPTYTNPVLPGDHPDPSVIRVGAEYWATATTSQWAPIFPLLRSTDLVNWVQVGSVFEAPPAWTEGSYWAPEISTYRGRFFVYYAARQRNGPLCVAVASAVRPAGPYRDHGPLVCQPDGSIDAAAVADEQGNRYLVWKEDGNSRKLPTPIWAQRLSADGTRLVGLRRELLRNEATWEGPLVEGPYILRRDGWFYMFYSAGGCCGRACSYKLGAARARRLLGPWERNPSNPILAGNAHWQCPGHGTVVTDRRGRTFLLYHGYDAADFQFAGRQGLLDEITWTPQGWPVINAGRGPSSTAPAPLGTAQRHAPRGLSDEFDGQRLAPGWQWPYNRLPQRTVADGALVLTAAGTDAGNAVDTIVARPSLAGDYVATTRLLVSDLPGDALAGLSAYGDRGNAIGIAVNAGRVLVWQRHAGVQRTLATANAPAAGAILLRMSVKGGQRYRFSFSIDGAPWQDVGADTDAGYLPPWDLAVRVALAVGGPAGTTARFDWLRVE